MSKDTKETLRTVASICSVVIQIVGLFLLIHFRPR
jgi:hypothetical protein